MISIYISTSLNTTLEHLSQSWNEERFRRFIHYLVASDSCEKHHKKENNTFIQIFLPGHFALTIVIKQEFWQRHNQ